MSESNGVTITDSILNTIKKLLGLDASYAPFDLDIMVHINTVFSNLTQMGVGPANGFMIKNDTETWASYFVDDTIDEILQQQIKSYIYLKVRLIFDPPANGNLMEALNKNASELEYRLYTLKGGY